MATASSPDSGPIITSALSCCIRRRVSFSAVAAVSCGVVDGEPLAAIELRDDQQRTPIS